MYTIIIMHVFLFVSGFGYFNFKISNLDMYNWDAIAAMNLKITVIILSSFGYTRQESKPPSISSVSMLSTCTTHGRKLAVLYLWFDVNHFWQEAIYSFKRGICEVEGLMCP